MLIIHLLVVLGCERLQGVPPFSSIPAQVSHGAIFTLHLITGLKEVLDIYDRELQQLIPVAMLSKV
jgi:hypothetical protein